MTERLDGALRALKARPADVGMGGLEASVWQRLDSGVEPSGAPSTIFAIRAASVIAFLCIGFAAGGVTAAVRPTEISVFSVGAELAPSTLLEGQ